MIGQGLMMLTLLQQEASTSDVWEGWGSVLLVCLVLLIGALVVLLVIWQVFKTAQSKMNTELVVANNDAYKKLAEQSVTAMERSSLEQEKIAVELADLRMRVVAIEKLLREVE